MTTSVHHTSPLRRAALLAALVAPALLAGCANQSLTRSGFLSDYDKLGATPDGKRALTYAQRAPQAAAAAAHRAVVIDEVQLHLPPEQQAAVAPALLQQARSEYRAALEKAFATRYQVVAVAPAGGALRVRAAITGLKPSNPTLNAATFLLVGPVSNGGVSTEAEVLDSATGQRVAAQATFTNGNLFNGGLGGYFDKLGHVRKALTEHAEQLRDLSMQHTTPPVLAAR